MRVAHRGDVGASHLLRDSAARVEIDLDTALVLDS